MTKIYEALEYAQKLRTRPERRETPSSHPPIFPSSGGAVELVMEKEMVRLYQNLSSVLSESEPRILQFIGSRKGEGTSTVVREFGEVSASKFNRRVLLLDADRRRPSQHLFFDIKPEYGWDDVVSNTLPLEKAIYRIGRSNLFLGPITQRGSSVVRIFSGNGIEPFWNRVRQRFDLVLIDSPPAMASSEGLAICRKVDGVILVVEAEKIRWPVAESTKENILRNGGKLLGIVFNKRRFYIPRFIYNRL